MKDIRQAISDMFRVTLAVALPIILILILMLFYRLLWIPSTHIPSLSSSQSNTTHIENISDKTNTILPPMG